MPDPLDFLKTRRSVSAAFLGPPGPDEDQIDEILTVASRVPDHGKLAPWRFIVFSADAGAEASKALADLYARLHRDADGQALEAERNRLAQAPLAIAVVSTAAPHPKIPEFEQLLSAGNAAYATVLAAHALGFAAHWVTGWIAYDADAGAILGLKPGERLVGLIHIGTPTVPITDRPRPALSDVVSRWRPPEDR